MARITLEGRTFYLAGEFATGSQQELAVRLEACGAIISDLIAKHLDCLIAGQFSATEYTRASCRQIPIINEAQLLSLLEEGQVEASLEPEADINFDVGEAISEVRGAFDGAPASGDWTRVLEVLEQAESTHQDVLLNYIMANVVTWHRAEAMPKWSPPVEHDLLRGVWASSWLRGIRQDELCVAPPVWLKEMFRGAYHPKHELTRLLNLHAFYIGDEQIQNVLKNPYLTQVHTLVLGRHCKPGESAFEAMMTAPSTNTVEHLYLSFIGKDKKPFENVWAKHSYAYALPALEHVYSDAHLRSEPGFETLTTHQTNFY